MLQNSQSPDTSDRARFSLTNDLLIRLLTRRKVWSRSTSFPKLGRWRSTTESSKLRWGHLHLLYSQHQVDGDHRQFTILSNLALQCYSRAHPRSGRWLVGFGWAWLLGWVRNPTMPNPTNQKLIHARASPETKQRAMQRMVIPQTPCRIDVIEERGGVYCHHQLYENTH